MKTDVPPLRLLFWETTAGCNLECSHCRRLDVSHELMRTDMTTVQARQMIDELAAFARCILVFSGGEPLMRPDVFDLAAHARAKELLIALASNGTLIDWPTARRIADTGFHRVSVSLDGADAATHDSFRKLPGSFRLAIEGLRNLREVGVSTQVNCTIARHNAHQLGDVLKLAESLGADAMHYFLLVPVGCGEQIADDQMLDGPQVEQRLREIYDLEQATTLQVKATCAPHYYRVIRQEAKAKRRRDEEIADSAELSTPHSALSTHSSAHAAMGAVTKGCLAGTAVCFVSHEGDVFPCGYLPVSAGNVTKQSLAEIWAGNSVFASLRDPGLLEGKCGCCEYKNVCAGCRARAFYQFGDFLAEEPYCEFTPSRMSASRPGE
jgi:radical SAM protein with 4Fe4S-binding SPASM domain